MSEEKGYVHERWLAHLEGIDKEIAQMAILCRVRLLDPGMISRVLQNDQTVCGTQNPKAFDKMRALLMMHYSVRDKAAARLGEQEAVNISKEIVKRLRARLGDQIGGTAEFD